MNRLKSFSPTNPTGETPGMEPVRLDVLKAAVKNTPNFPASATKPAPLVSKNLRLPADLVDYIDFVFTKVHRMKKQDAYAEALEVYFRPLMQAGQGDSSTPRQAQKDVASASDPLPHFK